MVESSLPALIKRDMAGALALILEKGKKQREIVEEQNLRLDRLAMSMESHGAKFDVLTTMVEVLESEGGVSAELMVVKANIFVLKKKVAKLTSSGYFYLGFSGCPSQDGYWCDNGVRH